MPTTLAISPFMTMMILGVVLSFTAIMLAVVASTIINVITLAVLMSLAVLPIMSIPGILSILATLTGCLCQHSWP